MNFTLFITLVIVTTIFTPFVGWTTPPPAPP
jgi:hypothetical protein